MLMLIEDYIPYKPEYDHVVDHILREGMENNEHGKSQLASLGIIILEPHGIIGSCQEWAFRQLGLPEYADTHLSFEDLYSLDFQITAVPKPGDLAVYLGHYGIYYDTFHDIKRVASKLGIWGAVCILPENAFAVCPPKYFERFFR